MWIRWWSNSIIYHQYNDNNSTMKWNIFWSGILMCLNKSHLNSRRAISESVSKGPCFSSKHSLETIWNKQCHLWKTLAKLSLALCLLTKQFWYTVWTVESVPRIFRPGTLQDSCAPSCRQANVALYCTNLWANGRALRWQILVHRSTGYFGALQSGIAPITVYSRRPVLIKLFQVVSTSEFHEY